MSSASLGERDRRAQPDLLRRRRHLVRHLARASTASRSSTTPSSSSTTWSSTRSRPRSRASAPAAAASSRSRHSGDVLVGPDSAGADPGPGLLRPRRHAADDDRRVPADGDPRPRRLRRRRDRASTPSAARRAFEALDTQPAASSERIAYAFRIAVTNIAEEVANVAIRHGADPRDFTLIAYGAAGPMLLPAALEQMHVRRDRVPPHPGLFSALGLLSSDLVYYDSRSAYVMLTPEQAPQIAAVFEEMERAPARALGHAAGRRQRPPQLRRPPLRPELGDAVRRGAAGADRASPIADRALPRRLRAPLRQPLPLRARSRASATASSSRSPPSASSSRRRARRRAGAQAAAPAPSAPSSSATSGRRRSPPASTRASSCRVGAARRRARP